jgi:hypothetical protein
MNLQNKIDERIEKLQQEQELLQQLRGLLGDPKKLALVKELLGEPQPDTQRSEPPAPALDTPDPLWIRRHRKGSLVRDAYDCLKTMDMDEPFTARDFIEAIRAAGREFFGNPNISIQHVLKYFVEQKVINVVEDGAGRRPRLYQRRRAKTEGTKLGRAA